MRIQPRQQIIEIWDAISDLINKEDKWVWGGRSQPNSISDAEQLACIMYPASIIPFFKVDLPDGTAPDVLEALNGLGGRLDIPQRLTEVLVEYIENYSDQDGTPLFSGGSYFSIAEGETAREPTAEQSSLDVVDAYSMSVSLMLYTIGFARVFRGVVLKPALRDRLDYLEAIANVRLSAAMVGLLRSFSINVFAPESKPGRALLRTVNQAGDSPSQVAEDLREALKEVRASVRDFTVGSGQSSELDDPSMLFELGWSWGAVKDAPEVEYATGIGRQRAGVAQDAPFLYFTVNALDGIADLFSERTVVLRLLNEDQQRLAQALRLRWQLTQTYWSIIAGFGDTRWPLEDIPWRTTDGKESDYYSLLVTSMVVQDLETSRGSDEKVDRVGRVLEELAQRGRITRRPIFVNEADLALALHSPGQIISLIGSEEIGPPMVWRVYDVSAVVLKRTLRLANMARSTELRDSLLGFADRVWEHVARRKLGTGTAKGLWDQPDRVYGRAAEHHELPSWYYTERVVECMVAATNLITGSPLSSQLLFEQARDLLNEAEHRYDFEVLNGSRSSQGDLRIQLDKAQRTLDRAREIIGERPGTAMSLAQEVLRDLDRLEVARKDRWRETL